MVFAGRDTEGVAACEAIRFFSRMTYLYCIWMPMSQAKTPQITQ